MRMTTARRTTTWSLYLNFFSIITADLKTSYNNWISSIFLFVFYKLYVLFISRIISMQSFKQYFINKHKFKMWLPPPKIWRNNPVGICKSWFKAHVFKSICPHLKLAKRLCTCMRNTILNIFAFVSTICFKAKQLKKTSSNNNYCMV